MAVAVVTSVKMTFEEDVRLNEKPATVTAEGPVFWRRTSKLSLLEPGGTVTAWTSRTMAAAPRWPEQVKQ